MRIVGISGVWSNENKNPWKNLGAAFLDVFPSAQFSVEEEYFCHPWEIERLRSFTAEVVAKHDDGERLLLVGHSMGGVIACASSPSFKRSPVCGIATIFSPHRSWGGVFTQSLNSRALSADVPIVSFAAKYDELVWWGAEHPQALEHIKLHSNHLTDIVHNKQVSETIAKETKRVLFKTA